MIYLRGPSIFGGYIDTSIESPFEQFDDHIEPFVMSTDPAERETRQLALTHNPPSAIAATSFQKEVMWYKTGDLGYTDADGFLFITGRLKRFVKIAGEMISLPFIETILLEKYGNPDITTLAIEAKEENGNVTIVAFTTFDVDLTELNNYIHTH